MPGELEKQKMVIAVMKTRGELIKFNLLFLLSILLCVTLILTYLLHNYALPAVLLPIWLSCIDTDFCLHLEFPGCPKSGHFIWGKYSDCKMTANFCKHKSES